MSASLAFGKTIPDDGLRHRIQFPERAWKDVPPTRELSNAEDLRVLEFLDRMEAKQGVDSVFYIW